MTTKTPLISIIMPVYNPEFSHLDEAIKSCVNQTYSNWELCMCDDASTKHYVKPLIQKWMKKDKRIKAVFSSKNEHICIASNKALSLAKGKYVGFLDNDDILHKDVLLEVVKVINEKDVDVIYTDEEKITNEGKISNEKFIKSNWDKDLFLTHNFVNHFTVIRHNLIKTVGEFEKGMEGAQDYDLLLKITEKTNKVYYIKKVLYYWRKSKDSIARSEHNKPYTRTSRKKAVENALKRRNINGVIKESKFNFYKIIYKVKDKNGNIRLKVIEKKQIIDNKIPIYLRPYYCYKEHNTQYTIKRTINYLTDPREIISLIKAYS